VGKGYHNVHIIFTPEVEEAMALLLKTREYFIPEENSYFFAIPHSPASCLNFFQTLRKVATASGMKNPHQVTSTRIRKYAATMFQVRVKT
jgi:hypothetical protein